MVEDNSRRQKRIQAFRRAIRWEQLRLEVRRWWRKLKEIVWPPSDYIEKAIDSGLSEVSWFEQATDMLGFLRPKESLEDNLKKAEMGSEEWLARLQAQSIVLTYKSTKRLERLTRALMWFTAVLAILTIICIFTLVHLI